MAQIKVEVQRYSDPGSSWIIVYLDGNFAESLQEEQITTPGDDIYFSPLIRRLRRIWIRIRAEGRTIEQALSHIHNRSFDLNDDL